MAQYFSTLNETAYFSKRVTAYPSIHRAFRAAKLGWFIRQIKTLAVSNSATQPRIKTAPTVAVLEPEYVPRNPPELPTPPTGGWRDGPEEPYWEDRAVRRWVRQNTGKAVLRQACVRSFDLILPCADGVSGKLSGGELCGSRLWQEKAKVIQNLNGSGFWTPRMLGYNHVDPSAPFPIYTNGDGTVPEDSARAFVVDSTHTYYFPVKHGDLPGDSSVQCKILDILTGLSPVGCAPISPVAIAAPDAWAARTESPIHVQLTSSSGNITGVDNHGNLRTEIPDSVYFRFPANEAGLVPFHDTYSVTVSATGFGLFTLHFDHLASGSGATVGFSNYTHVPVGPATRGHLTLSPQSVTPDLYLDVNGDGTVDFVVQANQPPNPASFPAVLLNALNSLSLSPGIANSLRAKLKAASSALGRGNKKAAKGQLQAFVNQVGAQRGKALSTAQADKLTEVANAGLALL